MKPIPPGETNPFLVPSSSSSSSAASSTLNLTPTGSHHKASLTVLLSSADLPEPIDGQEIDLPTVPPLSSELFMREREGGWNASEFLLGRRHMVLEEMRSELRAYLATLRTSLVEVINTEYESFISLSTGLRSARVSTSLISLRNPVLSLHHETLRVKEELVGMKEEMEGVLELRKDVRERKAVLRRLVEVEKFVGKVEGLLRIGEDGVGGAMESHDAPPKRIERIAGEYNQMLYLVSKAGPDIPFVKSLDPRIQRITRTLTLDLSNLLSATLTSPHPSREDLTTLFRTYSSLSLHSTAEEIFRKTIVTPYVKKTIHRDVLQGGPLSSILPPGVENGRASTPAIGSNEEKDDRSPPFYQVDLIGKGAEDKEPLAQLYNNLLDFIGKRCGLVLDITERVLASPFMTMPLLSYGGSANGNGGGEEEERKKVGYEVLAGVIWEEFANALMSELGHVIFAAGRPTIFHQNYTLTTQFLSRLESLSPTLSHLQSFRLPPTYQAFTKRFQLPVYFQLRLKEIVSSVERGLEGGANGGEFLLGETETVWRAMKFCWLDDVWVPELSGRFWRLTLQLLSRYRTWLNSVVPKYVPPLGTLTANNSSANLSALAAGTTTSRSSFDGGRLNISAAPSPRPGTPATPSEEVSDETTLKQLTVLIADAQLMEKKLLGLFESEIKPRLPAGVEDDGESSPASVLRESLALLTSIVPSLSSQIVHILTKRCSEHLKHVRAVASQVRVSTRKGAEEPSFFVANILKELKSYLNGTGKVIEEEERRKWATATVEEVANRYAAILSTQKKAEDSLRWLKKGRNFFGRGTSTPEDGSSDNDKVKLQMQLDVEALGTDAKALGVDVDSLQAFEALKNAIVDSEDGKK